MFLGFDELLVEQQEKARDGGKRIGVLLDLHQLVVDAGRKRLADFLLEEDVGLGQSPLVIDGV